MKNINEYIFDLICINENLIILSKNENLFNFIDRCKELNHNSEVISLFNQNSLVTFDNTLRLIANIIYERIPRDEDIELEDLPEFEEFKEWFATLTEVDYFTLLYYLSVRGYVHTKGDDELQYLLNVYKTAKVM